MIHYDLRCSGGHSFDGWFRSSAAFDQQAQAGLLDCPICASPEVSRAIMAPRLSRGAEAPAGREPEKEAPAGTNQAALTNTKAPPADQVPSLAMAQSKQAASLSPMPDQVRAALQRVRAEIERRCDYVGGGFAQAARDIHDGAVPPRPIYGETTPAEAEALAEDGIEVTRIPWVPRADG